jgi:hypothetical protein
MGGEKRPFRLESIVNTKVGRKSALISTAVVFGINAAGADTTLIDAGFAGMKQGAYVFTVSGFNTRLCEYLATRAVPPALARASATIVPPALSFAAAYTMHAASGTPRPFLSAAWAVLPNTLFSYINSGYFQREQQYDVQQGGQLDKTLHYFLRSDIIPKNDKGAN